MSKLKRLIEKANMWEMANFRQQETGLPVIVYVSDKGTHQHGPRIKVQNDYSSSVTNNWFSVTIEDNAKVPSSQSHIKINVKPKDLNKVKTWININQKVLLDYWNGRITTTQLVTTLKRI